MLTNKIETSVASYWTMISYNKVQKVNKHVQNYVDLGTLKKKKTN